MNEAKGDEQTGHLLVPHALQRWVMSGLAALLVYGNLAVALQPPQFGATALPRPRWLFDAFLLPGMFSSYTTTNLDFHLTGLRDERGLESERGKWIALDLKEHFPQRLGITFTQLYAPRHREVFGRAGQRAAWATLARKVRHRHNWLHPKRTVIRVRLAALEWPIDSAGYRGRKRPDTVRLRIWFEEPEAP